MKLAAYFAVSALNLCVLISLFFRPDFSFSGIFSSLSTAFSGSFQDRAISLVGIFMTLLIYSTSAITAIYFLKSALRKKYSFWKFCFLTNILCLLSVVAFLFQTQFSGSASGGMFISGFLGVLYTMNLWVLLLRLSASNTV
jgi:hypothetical protein